MNNFKNKMNEKIKNYSNKKYLNGYIKNEFLTDDGVADIFLKLGDKDELFDSRTVAHQLDLDSSIYEFIDEKASILDNDIMIRLHIIGLSLDSKEEEVVTHLLKEHYAIELYKTQKEYIQCRNKVLCLVLFGIITFISYTLLYFYTNFEFFLEVFGFLFSFSLWVAGECYIYDVTDVRDERKSVSQKLLMTVEFSDITDI